MVFLGFWSDWDYLNDLFASYFQAVHGSLVVLVDPQSDGELSAKAPALWAWASASTEFRHLPEKGDDFLSELRTRFSKNLLERVLLSATTGFGQMKPGEALPPTAFHGVSVDDLYAFRRDIRRRLIHPNTKRLATRSLDECRGKSASPCASRGRDPRWIALR